MGDHLVRASFFSQSKNEVGLYVGITGSYVERLLKLLDRFVQVAVVSQVIPEPVMGHKIPRGHGKGMAPERLAVAPVGSLDVSAPSQKNNGKASRQGQNPLVGTARCALRTHQRSVLTMMRLAVTTFCQHQQGV